MNHLIKEKLSKGSSIIHKLDPRVKLTVIIFFSIVVAVNDHIFSLSGALLFSALLILIAKLKIKEAPINASGYISDDLDLDFPNELRKIRFSEIIEKEQILIRRLNHNSP